MKTKTPNAKTLETLLACEQLHRLPMMLAEQAGVSWAARFEEAMDKSRQLAVWLLCAQAASLFQTYPEVIRTVEIRLEKEIDEDGGDYVVGQLWINKEHYNPGDENEFDVNSMETMDDIDGLVALNAAFDAVAMAVPKALMGCCDQIIDIFENEVFGNSGQAWAKAEEAAPGIHPQLQDLMLELSTPKVSGRATPKGRL